MVFTKPPHDEQVRLVLQNDPQAASELVTRLYPLVLKMVRAHLPARAAEEDLCQMIFIRIFQKLHQYSGPSPLEHWASRVAISVCLNQINFQKARPELRFADLSEGEQAVVENLASNQSSDLELRQNEAREIVWHLLTQLRPADRLLIQLLHLEQRSIQEIQQLTGWNLTLIKVRAFRARQKMRKLLEKIKIEPTHANLA